MENNIKPKFLRAKGIARYFDIGESTVWLYVKQGKIIKHKISAKVTLFDVYQAEKSLNLI